MVLFAVGEKNSSPKGVSMQAIKKYLVERYKVNLNNDKQAIFDAITSLIGKNRLRQISGKGFSGSFKLGNQAVGNQSASKKPQHARSSQPPPISSSNSPQLARPSVPLQRATFSSNSPFVESPKEQHFADSSCQTVKEEDIGEEAIRKARELKVQNEKLLEELERIQEENAKVEAEKAKIEAEKAKTEAENNRLTTTFRDDTLTIGDWCRHCLNSDADLHRFLCCGNVYYCSARCQHRDWRRHEPSCTNPRVKLGKCLPCIIV